MKRLAAFLFLIASVFSCCSPEHKAVAEVESYIQQKPDSAYNVLKDLDRSKLRSRKDIARFSLFYTMAVDKHYIDTTDLSIIRPALDYYKGRSHVAYRMMSLYYQGRIHSNNKDYSAAIVSFLEAIECSADVDDLYWKAMITSEIGNMHNRNFNNADELKYEKEAMGLWLQYGDESHIELARIQLANAFHNSRMPDQSDSVYALICANPDCPPRVWLRRADNEIKRSNPDPVKTVEWFGIADDSGARFSVENYYEYAYALLCVGENEKAEGILEQLSAHPDSYWLYRIAKERRDYRQAMEYLAADLDAVQAREEQLLSQSLYKAESEYLRMKRDFAQLGRKNAELRLLISILMSLVSICILVWMYNRRRALWKDERERMALVAEEATRMMNLTKRQASEEALTIQNELAEREKEISHIQASFAEMYQSQFEEIGRLLDYSTNGDIEAARNRHIEKINQILLELKEGDTKQRDFESRINTGLDNIMKKLRADYPDLKESDFRCLSYIIVGFDATTRSIIMNETVNYSRVRKSRLVKYVLTHPTENTPLYSCFLRKRE